jgi:hypothetical protein
MQQAAGSREQGFRGTKLKTWAEWNHTGRIQETGDGYYVDEDEE